MICLLDTNTITYVMNNDPKVLGQLEKHRAQIDVLGICYPVYYEIMRGLLSRRAAAKISFAQRRILPFFNMIPMHDEDWTRAAYFWAASTLKGRQLSDIDLLVAAIAYRINAVIVSSDTDFDALPVQREDWRTAS